MEIEDKISTGKKFLLAQTVLLTSQESMCLVLKLAPHLPVDLSSRIPLGVPPDTPCSRHLEEVVNSPGCIVEIVLGHSLRIWNMIYCFYIVIFTGA